MTLYLGNQKVAPTRTVNNGERYLIEASDESLTTSWYRIYSDGWCEQGGFASIPRGSSDVYVSLLKNYKKRAGSNYLADYFVNVSNTAPPDATSSITALLTVAQLSFDDFDVWIQNQYLTFDGPLDFYWEAKGFIDLEEAE